MAELSYTDFTQALRDAGVLTRKQHLDVNYHLRAKINQLDFLESKRNRELDDEVLGSHGQG